MSLPSVAEIEGMDQFPDFLDPNENREDFFGPVIAERENADVAFGEGNMVLYDDGSAELFLDGSNKSYVFRPFPDGGYVVYGPDGKKLKQIWNIADKDIPDPMKEAVD